MGNAQAHAAPQLRVVAALSGAAPLPLDAPEWQQLLTYASPLSRLDPGEVEREIRPHCAELGAQQPQQEHCAVPSATRAMHGYPPSHQLTSTTRLPTPCFCAALSQCTTMLRPSTCSASST